jgi:osmoprotectant transport system permease protein
MLVCDEGRRLIISLPLAFVCLRRPALRATLLTATSIVQTVPGLALLALFYPLLLGAASLSADWLPRPSAVMLTST